MSVSLHIRYALKSTDEVTNLHSRMVCFAGVRQLIDRNNSKLRDGSPYFFQVGAGISPDFLTREKQEKFHYYFSQTPFFKGISEVREGDPEGVDNLIFYAEPNIPVTLACAYLSPVRMVTEASRNIHAFLYLCDLGVRPLIALMTAQYYCLSPNGIWRQACLSGHSVVPSKVLKKGDIRRIKSFPSQKILKSLPKVGGKKNQDGYHHEVGIIQQKLKVGRRFSEIIVNRPWLDKETSYRDKSGYLSYTQNPSELMVSDGKASFAHILQMIKAMYKDARWVFPHHLRELEEE